jgi:hypothetical protein
MHASVEQSTALSKERGKVPGAAASACPWRGEWRGAGPATAVVGRKGTNRSDCLHIMGLWFVSPRLLVHAKPCG